MDNQNQNANDYLLLLEKIYGETSRRYYSYFHPVSSALALIAFFIIKRGLKKCDHSKTRAMFTTLKCILTVNILGILCSVPLLAWFSIDTTKYSDYLEYSNCELLQRLNVDTPEVVINIATFLEAQLYVMCIIFAIKPKKIKKSPYAVIAGISTCFILGMVLFVPFWFLTDFQKVKWFSRLDSNIQKEFCISSPKESIRKYKFYARNIFIIKSCLIGGLSLLLTMISSVMICRWKQKVSSEGNQDRLIVDNIMSMFWFLLFLSMTNMLHTSSYIFVSVLYGGMNLGLARNEVQYVISLFKLARTIAPCVDMGMGLAIFSMKNKAFRHYMTSTFKCERNDQTEKKACNQTADQGDACTASDLKTM